MAKDAHVVELEFAKKFVRKYFPLHAYGVSFDKEEGKVVEGYSTISSKQGMCDSVDWCNRGDHTSIELHLEKGVTIIDDALTNTLTESQFIEDIHASIQGISIQDYREFLDKVLANLHISMDEFVIILSSLYYNKVVESINKSLPKAQKIYDKWVEKGGVEKARKERIASTFGKDFIEELYNSILTFKSRYIELETDNLIARYKLTGYLRFMSIDEINRKSKEEAEYNWEWWKKQELLSIEDTLLRYDVGKCVSYKIEINESTLTVNGDIYGDTGKRLNFHTIFAGGYNIQKLHTRTLPHVYES